LAAYIARTDDVLIGVPCDLPGYMNGSAGGRRNDCDLCEAMAPAIEDLARSVDRAFRVFP
jgi:hypothetical protein